MLADHRPDDATYGAAAGYLEADGLVELVAVIGYYTLLSMVLKTFDVTSPEGDGSPGTED